MGKDVELLTDFGNIIKFVDTAAVLEHFTVSDVWLLNKLRKYPFPTVKERVQEQIDKLNKYLLNTGI